MGYIGSMLFAKNKAQVMLDLAYIPEPEVLKNDNIDHGHQNAVKVLRFVIGEELLREASYYGITFVKDSNISKKNQALFYFADIADDPKKIEHLGLSILKRFRNGEFPAYSPPPFEPPSSRIKANKLKKEPTMNDSCSGIGKIGLLTLGVTGSLAWLKKRKSDVERQKRKKGQTKR